ncbi:caspase, EACC1-associated type [Kribbella speibonae]|uniref:Tetratricopeptide repeat protein n=1 Tax=Kribbella speibonae TaxID=1572660 RepID=A0A4R0IRV6_9ACTN|nr:caspase family protein [Kribbella speibonae]TCC35400.1 tetratricopeptide repeat protein [Kribbella speibonae]
MTITPDPAQSWACLVGVSTYPKDDGLDDLPAVRNNIDALREILTDPLGTGLPDEHCVIIENPANVQELALQVEDVARKATDMFLLYFAGHGLIDPNVDGRLYLATSHALQDRPHFTSLAYDDVRRAMLSSVARNKVVVLDCCFSGLAHGTMAGNAAQVAGQLDIRGSCVLTATKSNQLAKAPTEAVFTAFTGQLVDVLRSGVTGGPELIDVTMLHEQLLYRLRSAGLPEPRISGTDTIGRLSLAINASWRPADAAKDPINFADTNEVYRIGAHLERKDDTAMAERVYRRALAAGNLDAMLMLGRLNEERGNGVRAERWYRESAGRAQPKGMGQLGRFFYIQGAFDEAELWFRKAAEAGELHVAELLGDLLTRRGATDEAQHWYRTAIRGGRTRGMIGLGTLLEQQGDLEAAIAWYGRAADAGDPEGWTCLGLLAASDEGLQEEAEGWLGKAVAAGEPRALVDRGIRHLGRNEQAAAVRCFRAAAEAGSNDGMVRLGQQLNEAGDTAEVLGEAMHWFQRAAKNGEGQAMVELGKMYQRFGDDSTAEDWYRRGLRVNVAIGMPPLLKLLVGRGDRNEAERVCRTYAEAGDIVGMAALAIFLESQGQEAEAKRWQARAEAASPRPGPAPSGS